MKTIFVTGGAGFIGTNFIYHMINKYDDYKIICIDKLTYAGNISNLKRLRNNKFFRLVVTMRRWIKSLKNINQI